MEDTVIAYFGQNTTVMTRPNVGSSVVNLVNIMDSPNDEIKPLAISKLSPGAIIVGAKMFASMLNPLYRVVRVVTSFRTDVATLSYRNGEQIESSKIVIDSRARLLTIEKLDTHNHNHNRGSEAQQRHTLLKPSRNSSRAGVNDTSFSPSQTIQFRRVDELEPGSRLVSTTGSSDVAVTEVVVPETTYDWLYGMVLEPYPPTPRPASTISKAYVMVNNAFIVET